MIDTTKTYVFAPNIAIPETFNGYKLNVDKVRYYIHVILEGIYQRKHNETHKAHVYSQLMRYMLGSRDESIVRSWLKQSKNVICDENYSIEGHYSKSYEISCSEKVEMFEITDRVLKAKILWHRSQRKDAKNVEENEINDYLSSWLNKFEFDIASADSHVENKALMIPVINMLNEIHVITDSYGRRHSPWTNLATQLRQYTTYNGEPLINNDIANSQLLNLVKLNNENEYKQCIVNERMSTVNRRRGGGEKEEGGERGRSKGGGERGRGQQGGALCSVLSHQTPIEGDRQFIQLVEEGKLYDMLLEEGKKNKEVRQYIIYKIRRNKKKTIYKQMRKEYYYNSEINDWSTIVRQFSELIRVKDINVGDIELTRSNFKIIIFSDILYGSQHITNPLTRMFARLFPNIANFIHNYKQEHGYAELAREMQRQESHLMYNCVVARLMRHHPEVPVITIHDSIMTTPEHCELVQRIMREEYNRAGLSATIKS